MDKFVTIVLLTLASKVNAVSSSCTVTQNETGVICDITVKCPEEISSDIVALINDLSCTKKWISLEANAIKKISNLNLMNDNLMSKIKKIQIKDSDINEVPQLISMANVEEIVLTGNKIEIFDLNNLLDKVTKMDFSHNSISNLNGNTSRNFKNVTTINLSYNLIKFIPKHYFKSFSELRILDLSHNQINEIDISAFRGMINLDTLILSYNNLQKVDEIYFKFDHLKSLSLAHNNISLVSKNSLRTLIELKFLDLSSNQIDTLEAVTFETLVDLKELDISDNKIKYIPKTLFSKNKNLDKLLLDNNNISFIEEESFSTQIKHISVNNNKITKISNGTFLGLQVDKLDLSNNNINQLDVKFALVNPNLNKIILKHNKISLVSPSAFTNLTMLDTLDLSYNLMTELRFNSSDLSKLTHLIASNNYITNIDNTFFEKLQSLSILDLTDNKIDTFDFKKYNLSKITKLILKSNPLKTEIEEDELTSLQVVTHLDISQTNLTEFKDQAFHGMKKLRTLISSKSKLKNIDPNAFAGADSIEVLDLSSNYLKSFTATNMNSLKELYLNNNEITDISIMFGKLINLENINLAQNKIKKIAPQYFTTIVNLKNLDLSGNTDLKIEDKTFESNTLIELRLVDCGFQDIQSVHISKAKNLKLLDLSSNKILFTLPKYFNDLKLTSLNLGNNKIEYIAPNTFEGCDKLQTLYLNNNNLKYIENESLKGVKVLENLDLSSNKITEFEINNLSENNKDIKISLDDNKLNSIQFYAFLNNKIKEISIGGNNIACKDIKHIIEDPTARVSLTASKLVSKTSNVKGISCIEEVNKDDIIKYTSQLASLKTQIDNLSSQLSNKPEIEAILKEVQKGVNSIPKNTSFIEIKDERNKTYIKQLDDKIINLKKMLEHAAARNQSDLYLNLLNTTKQIQYDLQEKLSFVNDKPPKRADTSKPLLLATAICSGSILLLFIVKYSYGCIKSRSNK